MRLKQEQLAEGRRLLAARNERGMSYEQFMQASNKLSAWLYNHADALLARREEIAREAVREFAEALIADYERELVACKEGEQLASGASKNSLKRQAEEWEARIDFIKRVAAARGVTLDEKS